MNHLLRRLAGRILRRVIGIDRAPVAHADLRGADLLMLAWSALFGACFASLVLIAFFGGSLLNAICRE